MPQLEMIVRQCDECQKLLPLMDDGKGQQGYVCCDEYFCTAECVAKHRDMTVAEWESEHYTEEGQCYFTEWNTEDELLEANV